MAKVEVEIDDATGQIKDVPEPLKGHFQKQFDQGFQKGMGKKAEELKPYLADPVERERAKAIEDENAKLKIADLERQKKFEEAQALRDEQHQKALKEKDEAITLHGTRLKSGVQAEIKAAALKAGARDGSLDELSMLLGGEIDFNEKLEPFVKGKDGKPAVDDKGQPISIEGRVKAYLDAHPHHKRPTGGVGGGAGGGASFTHLTGDMAELEEKRVALKARIAANSRDDQAVSELHEINQQIAQKKNKGA